MNPLIDQIMGRQGSLCESDDVPVPLACLPQRSLRDRRHRLERPRRTGPDHEEQDNVRSVIGEAEDREDETDREEETGLIPDDARELDRMGQGDLTTKMRPVKKVVQEPSYPAGEKEKYLTPYAALTAPDATPDALSPIDPSRVPGMSATQSAFKWGELEQTPPANAAPALGSDNAVNAMDVLLGRERGADKPPKTGIDLQQQGAITTEEAAMVALNISNPIVEDAARSKAAAALVANPDPAGGSLMPEHQPADSKKVYEAARRWM